MVKDYFAKKQRLDLDAFLGWFTANYRVWERKPFADFDYIQAGPSIREQKLALIKSAVWCFVITAVGYWLST